VKIALSEVLQTIRAFFGYCPVETGLSLIIFWKQSVPDKVVRITYFVLI